MDENELDTEVHPLDPPPLDNLEDIFDLPESLRGNEQLERWHREIVLRLRRESQGLPMKTVQTLLLQQIASHYVQIRHIESLLPDFADMDARQIALYEKNRRDQSTFWISMTQEFNRLLEKHQDKLMNKVLADVQEILKDGLPMITNKDERRALTRFLSEKFAEMEL
jgi:hypothetical protein